MEWFSFAGRVTRREYWIATAVLGGAGLVLGLLSGLIFGYATAPGHIFWGVAILLMGSIPIFISSLSFQVRRWHDLGRSGWWSLINLVPFGSVYSLGMLGFVPGVEGLDDTEDVQEPVDPIVTNPHIENLVATYKTLNSSYRNSTPNELLIETVKWMRDNEVQFSRALKEQLSGIPADVPAGEIVDGSDIPLAQLISQFGTARATTLSLLRDGRIESNWDRPLPDGSTISSLAEALVASDRNQLERLDAVIAA